MEEDPTVPHPPSREPWLFQGRPAPQTCSPSWTSLTLGTKTSRQDFYHSCEQQPSAPAASSPSLFLSQSPWSSKDEKGWGGGVGGGASVTTAVLAVREGMHMRHRSGVRSSRLSDLPSARRTPGDAETGLWPGMQPWLAGLIRFSLGNLKRKPWEGGQLVSGAQIKMSWGTSVHGQFMQSRLWRNEQGCFTG